MINSDTAPTPPDAQTNEELLPMPEISGEVANRKLIASYKA